ncbi:MAG: hypothetical protein JXR86_19330 [Spirochaetales bacterium]|nr:hypothetical protein [Spirochaetales bacterium]
MKKRVGRALSGFLVLSLLLAFLSCEVPTGNVVDEEVFLSFPIQYVSVPAGTVSLTWEDIGKDGYSYDVYFGTAFPLTLVADDTTALSYNVTALAGTTYYWQVISTSADNLTGIPSAVYTFTTTGVSSTGLTVPYGSYPANGATLESQVITELRWNISQFNQTQTDVLYYDVYLGTAAEYTAGDDLTTLPLLVDDFTDSEALPTDGNDVTLAEIIGLYGYDEQGRSTLPNNTQYYWGVIVTNENGDTAVGPVWTFTTAANNAPDAPELTGPADGLDTVANNTPMTWTVEEDYDGDILLCDIVIDTYPTASTPITIANLPVDSITAAVAPATQDTWNFTTPLPDSLLPDTTYSWTVTVDDGTATTTSETFYFTTDSNYAADTFVVSENFDGILVAADIPSILNPSVGVTIDNRIGAPYPSLSIPDGDSINTTPVNYFDAATLSFDMRVISGANTSTIFLGDSANPAGIDIVNMKVQQGVREVGVVQVSTAGAAVSSQYWTFDTPTSSYYVWYNDTAGASVDPAVAGRTGIQVNFDSTVATSFALVASATRTALTTYIQNNTHDFDVSGATDQVIVKNLEVADVTNATPGDTGWSVTTNSTYTNSEPLKTHLYAKTYNPDDNFEDYSWTLVGTFSLGIWTSVDIITDGDYNYSISFNGGTAQNITFGEDISTVTSGVGTYLDASYVTDMFAIVGGGETLYVDNIDFAITDGNWSR